MATQTSSMVRQQRIYSIILNSFPCSFPVRNEKKISLPNYLRRKTQAHTPNNTGFGRTFLHVTLVKAVAVSFENASERI